MRPRPTADASDCPENRRLFPLRTDFTAFRHRIYTIPKHWAQLSVCLPLIRSKLLASSHSAIIAKPSLRHIRSLAGAEVILRSQPSIASRRVPPPVPPTSLSVGAANYCTGTE